MKGTAEIQLKCCYMENYNVRICSYRSISANLG